MRAKDAVVDIQGWQGTDREKIERLYQLYCKEFADRIKIRYRNVKCSVKSLTSLAKEMDLWILSIRDRGKFTWISDSAGRVLYGFLAWSVRDMQKYIERGIQVENTFAVIDMRNKIKEMQAKESPESVESDYKIDKKILTYLIIGHLIKKDGEEADGH